MIRVTDLRKSYGGREVLRGLTMSCRPGVVTGLAGPNACGKTTLVKCLLGLVVPSSGSIEIDGADVRGAWDYRRKLGYMPQNPELPGNLRVREILSMLEDLRGERARDKSTLLAYFGLEKALGQTFSQLSGGTKQKVAAVAALMFGAPLVILDEPTAGMDPVSTVRFKDLLRDYVRHGRSALLVSHSMAELDQLASDLVYLAEGQVLFSGSIDELKARSKENALERVIYRLVSA